ncbi:hypothetical protein [Neptuniibacter sp. QD37_11]|uniref:hypothetical protein n=1 Tax=Neptuniibacter sp. QD37_11 TaxID=3398209 RepID=UPI0039F57BB8
MTATASATESKSLFHKWEDRGCGKPPYRCVGLYSFPSKALAEANPTAYNNQLNAMPRGYGCGSCLVCGTGLTHNFLIESKDGVKFSVGCDCVTKRGDAKLITEVERLEKERQKALREARRQKKQEERQAKVDAEHEAQRERNGGLTDYEQMQADIQALEDAAKEVVAEDLYTLIGFAADLRDGKGGFCDSIARTLDEGELPYGRGYDLMLEILAKKAGRKNSKAYNARLEELEEQVGAVKEHMESVKKDTSEKVHAVRDAYFTSKREK